MGKQFTDSIKHVSIEDDVSKPEARLDPQPHADPAPVAMPVAASTDNSAYQTMSGQPMSEETEHVYQRILAKTNFNTTQVAATIHKYLDPLSAIPSLDERTRFKTAVIQSKAQEGLAQEKILATFDGLTVALHNDQESITASASATKQREIDDLQKKRQESGDAIAHN